MSIEITLYTKKATKSSLIKYLQDHDFYKVKHFIDTFNDKNNPAFLKNKHDWQPKMDELDG